MSDDLLTLDQLGKFATALNTFKSEAVQLRILEALLAQRQDNSPNSQAHDQPSNLRRRAKRAKGKRNQKEAHNTTAEAKTSKGSGRVRKAAAGDGAIASLKKLLNSDFFSKPKTINDIIEHCKHNLARTFKANEFSGTLARLVRNGALSREKNSDDQYEYSTKSKK